MVLARSCALTAVRHLLAQGMKRNEHTVRQQLRAWYSDTPRKRGPKRQALRVETCFAPLVGWGVRGGAGHPTRPGPGCYHVGPALCGAGYPCGLSWVCDPRGVGDRARRRQTRLAAGVAAVVATAAPGDPAGLDGDRVGRSGLGRPVAVSAHHAAELAPVCAHQYRRQLSAHWGDLLATLDDVCAAPWD